MMIELTTERLWLRPVRLGDTRVVHAYASDPQNTQYMIHLPNDTREQTRQFLLLAENEWSKPAPAFLEFAIVLKEEQIGGVSLHFNETRTQGELGWIVQKKHWGKGYATEAAQALMEYAADKLNLTHLVAHCDARNIASRKVMEHLGMRLEDESGTRKNKSTGEIAQELRYGIPLERSKIQAGLS